MKKVGIITFHNSYNCGSMLETYALFKYIKNQKINVEVINFSNAGQQELYSVFNKNNTLKKIIKNIIIFPHHKQIEYNNNQYENFKNKNYLLSEKYKNSNEIKDNYHTVIAGSDQIWNTTIKDGDDAYFLNWVTKARRVAYAPSFGARRLENHVKDINKYKNYLQKFDALSIREKNGQMWLKELLNEKVPVLLDPTLLLTEKDYEEIRDKEAINHDYIFLYCPSFDKDICKFVKKISDKYNLPVIAWSTKSFYLKGIKKFGFKLPKHEDPSVYLNLIKQAKLVLTTSFHGTIFSSIYRKNFYVIKNHGMYENDDRVQTLVDNLSLTDRLIPYNFDDKFNYLKEVNYHRYENRLKKMKKISKEYLENNVVKYYEQDK